MRKLEMKIANRAFCKELNAAIAETGVQIERGVNLLTYRQTCELARFAADYSDDFPAYVGHFLDNVVEMWEHWDDVEPFEIEYGSRHYHHLKFVD